MNQVNLRTAQSSTSDDVAAAEDLVAQLGGEKPKLVFTFASRGRDHKTLFRALRERLPKETRIVGASTGGELTNRGYTAGTVLLAGLSGDFDAGIGVGRGLSTNAARAGGEAMDRAASELGTRVSQLDSRKHVGVVLDDGFKMKKEELLLGALEKNQGLVVVGGGASDHEMRSSVLYTDDGIVDDAVLTVLFATSTPWAAMRSHSYAPLGQRVRITKVDASSRRILEIDGKRAADRWSQITGIAKEQLTFSNILTFMSYSLALGVGREYFLRAVWKADDDDSLMCMNMVQEDQELDVVRAGDIVETTRRFFAEEIPRRISRPTAALFFDCEARRAVAGLGGKLDALGATFAQAPPFAGLNVHLETYCGFQINSTLTTLVFGAS